MVAFTPFEAEIKASVSGYTQQIALGAGSATSQVLTFNNQTATSVMIQVMNNNAAGGAVLTPYIRMSVESSTGIASANGIGDIPMATPAQGSNVYLFASPSGGTGPFNIAVIVSATPATAGTLWATPGQGGIGT